MEPDEKNESSGFSLFIRIEAAFQSFIKQVQTTCDSKAEPS